LAHQYINPDFERRGLKPNIWTFQAAYGDCQECGMRAIELAAPERGGSKPCMTWECQADEITVQLEGFDWFYAFCLPGELPDMDPIGPFKTEAEAVQHARED
jgi:hypothetical protein